MPGVHEAACDGARAWLSAHRDNEASHNPAHRTHIDSCHACQVWMQTADSLTQRVRIHTVGAGPDVAGNAIHAFRRRSLVHEPPSPLGRGLLAAAGAMALIVALVGITSGHYAFALDNHLGAELHAFEAALGVAFLLAARQPRRYVTALLPVTGTVAVLSAIASTSLMSSASIDPLMELSHIPPLMALAGLVLLVSDPRPRSVLRSASV